MTIKKTDKDMELMKASILKNLEELPIKDEPFTYPVFYDRFQLLQHSSLSGSRNEELFYILDKKTGRVKEWRFKRK